MKYSLSQKKGGLYEQYCCDILEKNNYDILERNFVTKNGEIDIIAKIDNTICFIEVKSLNECVPFSPKESVTNIKIKKIIDTSVKYLYMLKKEYYLNFSEINLRYDIMTIRFDNTGTVTDIKHYKNYFKPLHDYLRVMLS